MELTTRFVKANKTLLIILGSTFLVVLPVCFHSNHHSMFFIKFGSRLTKENLRKENSQRLKNAEKYYNEVIKQTESGENIPGIMKSIDIAITIVTVSRNRHEMDEYEPKYLTQTAMKIQELIATYNDQPYHIFLSVCNVERDVDSYDEAKSIDKIIPVFNRFEKVHFSLVHILEKEKEDYVFCLNHTLSLHPRYVLLVEDDAFPTQNMVHVLDHVINTQLDNHSSRGILYPGPRSPTAFVKFYHPERLQSYFSADVYRIIELLALSLTVGTFVSQLHYLIFIDRLISRHLLWFAWSFYFMVVFISIGHPNVVQLRTYFAPYLYSVRPSPSCCTPAILFPAKTAHSVINYMHLKSCGNNYGKDSVLDDMLKDTQLSALYVEPNVFQHIGMYSALKTTFVDPLLV